MYFKNIFGRESVIEKVERAKNPTTTRDELLHLVRDSEVFNIF